MTDLRIDTPSGTIEIPDSASPDVIRGAIAKYATDAKSREAALRQWADHYVERERRDGGMLQVAGDAVRNIARGTPVGSWLDEANALTHAATGGNYDEAKAYQGSLDRAADQSPGSTAFKIAGGLASIPASPAATLVRGATMLPKVINSAATGLGYGALYGAGEGDNLGERAGNAAVGAGVGGAIGAGAPVVARGVGNAIGYIADKFKGVPAPLDQFNRGAVNRVTRAASDDAVLDPNIVQRLNALGPEGMIGDLGPNLQGQVGAVARTPGQGQATVVKALDQRASGAGSRINREINSGLGPPVDLPAAERAIDQRYSAQAKPFYEQFRNSQIPYTRELEDIVERLKNEPSVLRDARRMADLDPSSGSKQFFANQRPDGSWDIKRTPNASEWDYIKQSLDGLAYGASATKNDKRIYGGYSAKIRDQIDNILSPGDPTNSPWAKGRAIAGEGITTGNAIDEGRQAFSKNISPDEMRAAISGNGPAQQLGYTLGARQNVRDIGGNASTKWGENEAAALRSRLGSQYAREKLDILAPGASDRIAKRLDTETVFDKTTTAAKGNSVTAAMQAAQKEFPNRADNADVARSLGSSGATGLVLRGVRAIANALTGGAIDERRAAIAADAAKLLVNNGADRNQIAQALVQYKDSKGITQQGVDAIDRMVQALVQAPRQAVIDSYAK